MQNKTSVQIQMMLFDFDRKFISKSESRKNKFSNDRMQAILEVNNMTFRLLCTPKLHNSEGKKIEKRVARFNGRRSDKSRHGVWGVGCKFNFTNTYN